MTRSASNSRVLITYSTVDGHTRKICLRLKEQIEADGATATVMTVAQACTMSLDAFDKIVVGASIRYGKHRPEVYDFIARHNDMLVRRPSAFFTVNIVARKPGKDTPETNPYMRKFLQRVSWRPAEREVFAGKLDYPRYGFLDRQMIRLIMLITHGPTDPTAVVEFTDWDRVDAFARRVRAMPGSTSPAASQPISSNA